MINTTHYAKQDTETRPLKRLPSLLSGKHRMNEAYHGMPRVHFVVCDIKYLHGGMLRKPRVQICEAVVADMKLLQFPTT